MGLLQLLARLVRFIKYYAFQRQVGIGLRVVILKSHIKNIKSIRTREFEKLLIIEAPRNDVDFSEKVNLVLI